MLCFFGSGVVVTKSVQYYSNFPDDPIYFKALVGVTIGLCLVHTCVFPAWAWDWLIEHFGDPSTLGIVPLSYLVSNVIISIISLMVQHFFAWRIYKLSGGPNKRFSIVVPAIISLLSFAQFTVLAIVDTQAQVADRSWLIRLGPFYGILWGCINIVADFLITGSILYLLLWKTRNNHFSETRAWLLQICVRAVETNVLSLVLQIIIIIFMKETSDMWFILGTGCLPQIYAFSLLLSLTGRTAQDRTGSTTKSHDNNPGRSLNIKVDVQSQRRFDQHEPSVHFGTPRTYQTYDIQLEEKKTAEV